MIRNTHLRHSFLGRAALVTVLVVSAVLTASSPVSAATTYQRTSLYTFPSSFSTSVAVTQSGDLIVGRSAPSELARISNGSYTSIYSYSGTSFQVYDVKVEADGGFIVAEFGSPTGQVTRITSGGVRTVVYSPGSLRTPLALAIDTDGGYIVYASDFAGSYQALVKINKEGSVQKTYNLPRDSRGNGRVAVDKDGNYLITQAGDSPGSAYVRLLKINRTTSAVTTVYEFDKSAFPSGLAVDSHGDYIVAEQGSQALSKITPAGQREVLYQFSSGTGPCGVDIDSAGDYFVAEVGTRTISKISVQQATPAGFPDVPDTHPYYAAINGMAARGIIGGYANGNFGPDDLVTRQQFAKMIVKTLALTVTGSEVCPFVDVGASTGTDPFYPASYIAVCALNNITKGIDATHFAPGLNIKRQQMISMVVRAADNLAPGTLQAVPQGWAGVLSYADPTHGANIKKAEYNGLLADIQASLSTPGLSGWDTTGYATRGEVAQILWNLLQLIEK